MTLSGMFTQVHFIRFLYLVSQEQSVVCAGFFNKTWIVLDWT